MERRSFENKVSNEIIRRVFRSQSTYFHFTFFIFHLNRVFRFYLSTFGGVFGELPGGVSCAPVRFAVWVG